VTVYIVERGEQSEGGVVDSVWSNHHAAVTAAIATKYHFPGGWKLIRNDCWYNGCDYVRIVRMEVDKEGRPTD
jgi:hypothetical protein